MVNDKYGQNGSGVKLAAFNGVLLKAFVVPGSLGTWSLIGNSLLSRSTAFDVLHRDDSMYSSK